MFKNVHIWIWDYIGQSFRRIKMKIRTDPIHVIFSVVDHFEPRNGGGDIQDEIARAKLFFEKYEPVVRQHKDSCGVPPQYSFFFPIDAYVKECVNLVADFCRKGFGELEVHLHHKDDTEGSLRKKLLNAVDVFKGHGCLNTDKRTGETKYGFIHGNWALCNSRPDGKWCGVNEELRILKETGCYADFTMPSAPSDTQTAKINSIYYAVSTSKPKAHNNGVDVAVGKKPWGDLMIVQGPLMLNWNKLKIENGSLMSNNPVTEQRIRLWLEAGVYVKGRPDVIFIKLHNHGCKTEHLTDTFFSNLDWMFSFLEKEFNDGKSFFLHYMTSREVYNVIKALESGEKGNPSEYRDYHLLSNLVRP